MLKEQFLELLENEQGALVFHVEPVTPKIRFFPRSRNHRYQTHIKGYYLAVHSPEPLEIPDHCVVIPEKSFQESVENILLWIYGKLASFWRKKTE